MKKLLMLLAPVLVALVLPFSPVQAGWDPNERVELIEDAEQALRKFKRKDPSLEAFFDNAAGWVVFPTVGKGGMVVGGAFGNGVVYAGGKRIGFSKLKQVTVGFQLGGQAYSELIFFKDQATLDRFKSEKIEFDAQISAVAANIGAAANADYSSGVAVFTLTKGGLMYEASLGGQHFSFEAE